MFSSHEFRVPTHPQDRLMLVQTLLERPLGAWCVAWVGQNEGAEHLPPHCAPLNEFELQNKIEIK